MITREHVKALHKVYEDEDLTLQEVAERAAEIIGRPLKGRAHVHYLFKSAGLRTYTRAERGEIIRRRNRVGQVRDQGPA